jgi:hypothetical protein
MSAVVDAGPRCLRARLPLPEGEGWGEGSAGATEGAAVFTARAGPGPWYRLVSIPTAGPSPLPLSHPGGGSRATVEITSC